MEIHKEWRYISEERRYIRRLAKNVDMLVCREVSLPDNIVIIIAFYALARNCLANPEHTQNAVQRQRQCRKINYLCASEDERLNKLEVKSSSKSAVKDALVRGLCHVNRERLKYAIHVKLSTCHHQGCL